MKTTFVSSGRLVVPKEIRHIAGLKSDIPLEIQWREGVVKIDEGVAVVAATTWQARNAALMMKVEEEPCESGYLDAIPSLKEAMAGEPSKVWEDEGDIDNVLSQSEKITYFPAIITFRVSQKF